MVVEVIVFCGAAAEKKAGGGRNDKQCMDRWADNWENTEMLPGSIETAQTKRKRKVFFSTTETDRLNSGLYDLFSFLSVCTHCFLFVLASIGFQSFLFLLNFPSLSRFVFRFTFGLIWDFGSVPPPYSHSSNPLSILYVLIKGGGAKRLFR